MRSQSAEPPNPGGKYISPIGQFGTCKLTKLDNSAFSPTVRHPRRARASLQSQGLRKAPRYFLRAQTSCPLQTPPQPIRRAFFCQRRAIADLFWRCDLRKAA
jgi:hypothetical protein